MRECVGCRERFGVIFGASNFGLRVHGFGLWIQGSDTKAQGLGCRDCKGFRAKGYRVYRGV